LRKTLIAAVAALLSLGLAALAFGQADGPGAEVTVSISPKNAGTSKKPKPAKLNLKLVNEDSSQTADSIEVFVAKNFKASTTGLKKCSAAKLEANGTDACPAASRIGRGTADAIAGVNTASPTSLKFNITAFVIGTNQLGFYLEQQGGEIRVLSKGKFKRASGRYGQVLDIDIPQLAREFPPGVYNGLVGLETSLYKKIGNRSLFKTTGCPSNRTLPFKLTIGFQNNPNPPKVEEVEALGGADCTK